MTFAMRLLGAARLDRRVYEDVEADARALPQAIAVVVLSSLAAGVGLANVHALAIGELLIGSAAALLGWIAWAMVTYYVGTRLLPQSQTRADAGQLLRTIGFAASPGLLRVIGIVPGLAVPVFVLTAFWMLAAMIVAVRQALDYSSTRRALAVCAAGWLLSLVIAMVIGLIFAPTVY